jgi:uncharacterized SAM-binding protein YcdF (DUF218 family)
MQISGNSLAVIRETLQYNQYGTRADDIMYEVKLILQAVLLPPMNSFFIAMIGISLRPRPIGRTFIWCAVVLFLISSIPVIGILALREMPRPTAIGQAALEASQAIILLSGGLYPNAREYDGIDTVSNATLVRARYAAWLYRKHRLPILIVGERVIPSRRTEADVGAELLKEEFQVPVRWIVEEGRDTIESAGAASRILLMVGIKNIALVTSPRHMPRAVAAFENVGFTVYPAPTTLRPERTLSAADFIPSNRGFGLAKLAMNEWLGRLWTWLVEGI